MPGRFRSPLCPRCLSEPESTFHRYQSCKLVEQAWQWVFSVLLSLDISFSTVEDSDILRLNFEGSLRENAILWLVGSFVEIVESEGVVRGNYISANSIRGILKQKKSIASLLSLPELGPIIELDSVGIG